MKCPCVHHHSAEPTMTLSVGVQSDWQFLGSGLVPVTDAVRHSLQSAFTAGLRNGSTATLLNVTTLGSPTPGEALLLPGLHHV